MNLSNARISGLQTHPSGLDLYAILLNIWRGSLEVNSSVLTDPFLVGILPFGPFS